MTASVQAPAATTTIACLPAQALHIAAQFVSTTGYKENLNYVAAQSVDNVLSIMATDGTRAFRIQLDCRTGPWYVNGGLIIQSSAFKKRIPYATYAFFKEDGTVDIHGGKKSRFASDKVPPMDLIESRPWKANHTIIFPKINQIWPGEFKHEPKAPLHYNAQLLSDFLDQVSRYSSNGVVRQDFNGPLTPITFSSNCSIYGCEDARLEFLLMPVNPGKI